MKVIEVICSDRSLHRERLETRRRGLSAFPEPHWDEVMARAAATEPWPDDRLVIDGARLLLAGVDAACAYLHA